MEQNPNAFGKERPVLKVCPICGGTMLGVETVATAIQDNNGHWSISASVEDLDDEFQDPNIGVRCLNEACGPLYYKGSPLPTEDSFTYWLNNIYASQLEEADAISERAILNDKIQKGELRPTNIQEYNEFLEETYYVPWEGTMNQVVVIS